MRRALALAVLLGAGVAAAGCTSSGSAIAERPAPTTSSSSVTPTATEATPTTTASAPPTALGAGEVGTRGQVPWDQVGGGWTLALWSPFTPAKGATDYPTLFLVDPLGGRYRIATGHQVPIDRLVAWSPDHRRALYIDSSDDRSYLHELDLATAKTSDLTDLGGNSATPGYTLPSGAGFVVSTTNNDTNHSEVTRYDHSGRKAATLLRGTGLISWLYAPDGASLVMGNDQHGPAVVVRNDGTLVRELTDGPDSCVPPRWWDPTTVLMSCRADKQNYHRLWLVHPASGSSTALTAAPPKHHAVVDFGYANAWKVASTTYLQWTGDCGAASVRRLRPDGTGTTVPVPHSLGSDRVIAVSGSKLVIWTSDGCDPASSHSALLSWDSATGVSTVLLGPEHGEIAVADALGADDVGGHA